MSKYIDIAKHLQTLLFEYSPVIIPGIGALNTRYKAAQLDENMGIITPPVKTLELNERMRGNDGLLSSHIARTEKISEADAETEIKVFTDLLLHKIDTNGKAIIDGIGELYREANGSFGFLPDPKTNFSSDTFGLQSITIGKATAEPIVVSTAKETAIGAGIGTVSVIEEPISDTKPRTLVDILGKDNNKTYEDIPASGNILTTATAQAETNHSGKVFGSLNEPAAVTTTEKRRKNNWLVWLLPLFILLLFFGLFSRLSSNKKTDITQETTTNTEIYEQEPIANNEQDAANNETTSSNTNTDEANNNQAATNNNGEVTTADGLHTIVGDITITNSQANEYINTNAEKGYYLIVGAWRNKDKVEEIANYFKKQQYKVTLLETNTQITRIALNMPQTISEIKAEYMKLRETNPDIWVLHYK